MKKYFITNFKYKHEYESPFGEYWLIYRILFGFIPINHSKFKYEIINNRENTDEVEKYIESLNNNTLHAKRDKKLMKILQ